MASRVVNSTDLHWPWAAPWLASLPAGPVSAVSPAAAESAAAGGGNPTLRRGPARRAGLLAGRLDRLVTDAEALLGPSPEHLWLDPTTDSFLVILGNSVHPVRSWCSGSAPRVAAANQLARAVPVRTAPGRGGRTSWFSGMAGSTTATLTLPALDTSSGGARLSCALWWDTEPHADLLTLEATTDGGTAWQPVPFVTERRDGAPEQHAAGTATGWSGRVWHGLTAGLPAARSLTLRWRYATDRLYVGRGAYVGGMRVRAGGRVLFDEARPADAARVEATGWTRSAD